MISPLNRGSSMPGGGAGPSGNQAVAVRVAIIGAVLLGLFAIVFFRLWYLQVLSGDSLAAQATQNRTRAVPVTAPRGDIVDRNGKTIVHNKRLQIVELSPASLPDSEREGAATYGQQLTKYANLPAKTQKVTPKPQVAPLTDPALMQRYKRLGNVLELRETTIRSRVIRSLYQLPYANIPVKTEATDDEAAYVMEHQELLPGVSVSKKFVRSYPEKTVGAQMLGQVGPVPIPEAGKKIDSKFRNLTPSSIVGLNGLEYKYDGYLRGKDGQIKANIDAFGNVVGTPTPTPFTAGNKLQLTLDSSLQEVAQDQFKVGSAFNPGGLPGAAVALDPETGEVLAMVSAPTYDANIFTKTLSDAQYAQLKSTAGGTPLFNRAIQGGSPPGSTFKVVTAFAATAPFTGHPEPVTNVNEEVVDQGFIKISDTTFQNAGKTPNGPVALRKALQVSSDVYFYEMGQRLNKKAEPLQQWARNLGYGHKTGLDLPGESAGTIPDRKWREELKQAEAKCRREKGIPQGFTVDPAYAQAKGCGYSDMRDWSVGDQVNMAVGQGDTQVTPLQSAVAYSAIENGGKIVTPHLARSLQNKQGATTQEFSFPAKKKLELNPTVLGTVRDGLHDAANEPGGTSAEVFADWPKARFPIYGKTGTAERPPHPDDSWYAAYVPDPKRPIVIVATVQGGLFGAQSAAPIVGTMLKSWYRLGDDVKIAAGKSATR